MTSVISTLNYNKSEPQDNESFVPLFIGAKLRIGIVHSMWNTALVDEMVKRCLEKLHSYGMDNVHILSVPGCYELPRACQTLLNAEDDIACDLVIAIGCLIQGATSHMDIVGNAVASSLQQVSLRYNRVVIFGITTCHTVEQAIERIPLGESYAMSALVAWTTQAQSHLQKKVQHSVQMIKEHLDKNPVLCFNGGKDSCVLLELLSQIVDLRNFPILFFDGLENEFEEIRDTIQLVREHYHLENVEKICLASPTKECLKLAITAVLEKHKYETMFMGRRSTDCKESSNRNWTGTTKQVDPIFDWSYHEVWHFILRHKVPFCSLYEKGYTSLGYKSNTKANPYLPKEKPAWYLVDGDLERMGRF